MKLIALIKESRAEAFALSPLPTAYCPLPAAVYQLQATSTLWYSMQ